MKVHTGRSADHSRGPCLRVLLPTLQTWAEGSPVFMHAEACQLPALSLPRARKVGSHAQACSSEVQKTEVETF